MHKIYSKVPKMVDDNHNHVDHWNDYNVLRVKHRNENSKEVFAHFVITMSVFLSPGVVPYPTYFSGSSFLSPSFSEFYTKMGQFHVA